jgi:hypothetical protein
MRTSVVNLLVTDLVGSTAPRVQTGEDRFDGIRAVRCGGSHPANRALVHEIVGKTMVGVLGQEPRW